MWLSTFFYCALSCYTCFQQSKSCRSLIKILLITYYLNSNHVVAPSPSCPDPPLNLSHMYQIQCSQDVYWYTKMELIIWRLLTKSLLFQTKQCELFHDYVYVRSACIQLFQIGVQGGLANWIDFHSYYFESL
jgi:hypothetical protein